MPYIVAKYSDEMIMLIMLLLLPLIKDPMTGNGNDDAS